MFKFDGIATRDKPQEMSRPFKVRKLSEVMIVGI